MSMDIPQPAQSKILVIGETCLDEYVFGDCKRISAEAPVPILENLSIMACPCSLIGNLL